MIEATNDTFGELVYDSKIPVLIDFWAPWCQPCKTMAPIFEKLSEEFAGQVTFVKVNIDDTDLAADYKIRGVPAFVLSKPDDTSAMISGGKTIDQLRGWLTDQLSK